VALCRLVVFEFNFVNNLCRIIDEKNIIASCGLRAQEKRLLLSTWSCYIFFLSVVACWFSVAGLYMIVVDVVGLLVVDYRCRLSITFSSVGAHLCTVCCTEMVDTKTDHMCSTIGKKACKIFFKLLNHI
jgi:hypothetical protein